MKERKTDLQIRGVSVDLREKLRDRAESMGKTMSQYAIELLEKDLAYPTLDEWLDDVKKHRIPVRPGGISAAQAVREAREERAEQLAQGAEERAKRAAG